MAGVSLSVSANINYLNVTCFRISIECSITVEDVERPSKRRKQDETVSVPTTEHEPDTSRERQQVTPHVTDTLDPTHVQKTGKDKNRRRKPFYHALDISITVRFQATQLKGDYGLCTERIQRMRFT